MRKISPKTVISAVFCALTAAVLGACIMEPVGLTVFLEDDKVIEIIERGAGKVNLIDGSDSGLTAGNSKISGLNPGKYYKVEEYVLEEGSTVGTFIGIQFVKADGSRSLNLVDIGRVSGGTITGLINDRWYRVNAAGPLTGSVSYEDLAAAPAAGPLGTPYPGTISGEINLPAPDDSYYLDLSASIIVNTAAYQIAKAGSAPLVTPVAGDIIKLEGEGTTNDYVFFNILTEVDFYVLKVVIEAVPPPPPLPELTIVITPYQATPEAPIVFTPPSQSISQATVIGGGATFSVTASGVTVGTNGGWYYGDTLITGTAILTSGDVAIAIPSINFEVIGDYVFTFVGESGTLGPFSADFTIKIIE